MIRQSLLHWIIFFCILMIPAVVAVIVLVVRRTRARLMQCTGQRGYPPPLPPPR